MKLLSLLKKVMWLLVLGLSIFVSNQIALSATSLSDPSVSNSVNKFEFFSLPEKPIVKEWAGQEDEEKVLLAAKKKKKKKKGKKKKSGEKKSDGMESKKTASSSIQVGGGLLLGLKTEGAQTGYVGTADYKMPFGSNLTLQIGGAFWNYDVIQDFYAVGITTFTFGGGAGYNLAFGRSMWLEAAVHLIFASMSGKETADVDGTLVESDVSASGAGVSINAGFHYSLGSLSIGPEVRIPVIFDKDVSDAAGTYVLFFAELEL